MLKELGVGCSLLTAVCGAGGGGSGPLSFFDKVTYKVEFACNLQEAAEAEWTFSHSTRESSIDQTLIVNQ